MGALHFILLDAGECGEKLRACLPELNWSKGTTFCGLPLSEFLVLLCAGSITSAESTQNQWLESVPTIKNMTEVWGAIIMHVTDWSRCNLGTMRWRISKAAGLMDALPILYPDVPQGDMFTYDVASVYQDKTFAKDVKTLYKAVDDASTDASTAKAEREFEERIM